MESGQSAEQRSLLLKKKKSPCKTSSFPLVPLNEITSFSEEWGGFQTFHVLRTQRRETGIQDFHIIQSQDSLTQTVQYLRLENLKSNLIFLGVNCLTHLRNPLEQRISMPLQ